MKRWILVEADVAQQPGRDRRGARGGLLGNLDKSVSADMIAAGMNAMVQAAKAMADPTRVRILALLRRGEACVCELGGALSVTQSTLSTHLQVIRRSGLVRTRRVGKWVYYRIADDRREWLAALMGFFESTLRADATLRRAMRWMDGRLVEQREEACGGGAAQNKRSKRL